MCIRDRFKGAPEAPAPADGDGVVVLGPPLGDQQIVPAVFLVEVRPLWKGGILGIAAAEAPQLSHQPAGGQVDPAADNTGLGKPGIVPGGGAGIVGRAVLIPEQGRVDPTSPFQYYRIGPGARRVRGGTEKILPGGHIGGNQVEGALMPPDGRGEDAGADVLIGHMELFLALQHMADAPPVGQIPAVVDGNPGKIAEGGGHQIVVLSHPADGGVRVKAPEDGVLYHVISSCCLVGTSKIRRSAGLR